MDWLRPLHLLVVYLFLVVTISTVACSTSDEVEYTDLQYTTSSPPTGAFFDVLLVAYKTSVV